jgi:hypothetical protein
MPYSSRPRVPVKTRLRRSHLFSEPRILGAGVERWLEAWRIRLSGFLLSAGAPLRQRMSRIRGQEICVGVDAWTLDGVPVHLAMKVRLHVPLRYEVLPEHSLDAMRRIDDSSVLLAAAIDEAIQECVRLVLYEDLGGRRVRIAADLACALAPMVERLRHEVLDARVLDVRRVEASLVRGRPRRGDAPKDSEGCSDKCGAVARWENEGGAA